MDATQRIKQAAATLMVGFLLAIAFAAPAQAGSGTRQGMTAQEWKAVKARAEAMNRYYHLGMYSPEAQEWKAVKARAEAMNRYYHLGTYSPQAQESKAVKARAEAMNRYYHLGRYAVASVSNPFDWADAGIGAGAMLGALLVAAVAVRRRTVRKPSFPSTT